MADKPKHEGIVLFLICIFAFALLCVIMWLGMHKEISSGMRWVRVGELHIIGLFTQDYVPFMRQLKALPPEQIRPGHLLQMTEIVTNYARIPAGIVFFLMAAYALFSKDRHPYARKLNLETLIREQSNAFSVTEPITKFNPLAANYRYHGSALPAKLPMFAEALTPDEWVSYCSVPVNDGVIDEDAARRALAQQLGGRWKGAKALPLFAQALFVAFSMKANGMRTESDLFLGKIAHCWHPKKGFSMPARLKAEVHKKLNDPKFGRVTEKIAAQHAFIIPALLRCLQSARDQGGVLAPAQFLWLRGINRHYWYALNNLGRGSVHIEAAGALAHYRAEKAAGKPIPNPLMEPAIDGLKTYLRENYIEQFPAKEFKRA